MPRIRIACFLQRRHLVALLAGGSLLISIALLTLWHRAYRISDLIWINRGTHSLQLLTGQDELLLKLDSGVDGSSPRPLEWRHVTNLPMTGFTSGNWRFWATTSERRSILGIIAWGRANYGRGGIEGHGLSVTFPFWLPIAFFLLIAAALFAQAHRLRRRYRRASQSLCPNCGYDLRATPNRCPECGTAATPAPATS